MEPVFAVDEDCFPRADIADEFEFERVEDGVFRRDHVLLLHAEAALPQLQGADAVRIPESQNSLATDECDCRVGPFALSHDGFYRSEDVFGRQFLRVLVAKRDGEDIQEDFGIGIGIEVVVLPLHQFLPQLIGVSEVAVVRERDAERSRNEKRLCLEFAAAARRRIPNVADAHGALQALERFVVEDVADHAVALLQMELVVIGDDPCSVLAAVLEHNEAVIEILDDVTEAGDGDDSTHIRDGEKLFACLLVCSKVLDSSKRANPKTSKHSNWPCENGCAVPEES